MSRYLTVEEVAETLSVSVSWVYKHKQLLDGVQLGPRMWRFPEQALEAFLASRGTRKQVRRRRRSSRGLSAASHSPPSSRGAQDSADCPWLLR